MKINDTCHEQEIRPTKVQYSNIYLSKVTAGEMTPDHRQGHKEFRGEEIKGGGPNNGQTVGAKKNRSKLICLKLTSSWMWGMLQQIPTFGCSAWWRP
jgi:hypothetical protein